MCFEFATASRILFGPGVVSEAAREYMDRIPVRRPGNPPLGRYGMTADDIPVVVAEAQKASSTKGNPIALQDRELAGVLRQTL